MMTLTLEQEAAALGGYTIASGTGQDAINKARALRRINIVKSDIISRYGGKWDANYREGWLPLVPLYTTGTVTYVNGSRTVTGDANTVWDVTMKGRKLLGSDGSYYKIANVSAINTLTLSQPYQGASVTAQAYQIWKDEYRLYPEVLTLGGFANYYLQQTTTEAWAHNMKDSFAKPSAVGEPTVHTVIGRERYVTAYSAGTVSGSINSNIITGVGTSWMANIEPGFEFTIGAYTYHVLRINSDTEIELYQQLAVVVSTSSYTSKGKNALVVRFQQPSSQEMVGYWYWAKDYPMVNDNDEDWITESYPKVVLNGMMYYDYMDKNDPIRTDRSSMAYENSIKDMKVAIDGAFTGVRTIGYYFPDAARE